MLDGGEMRAGRGCGRRVYDYGRVGKLFCWGVWDVGLGAGMRRVQGVEWLL